MAVLPRPAFARIDNLLAARGAICANATRGTLGFALRVRPPAFSPVCFAGSSAGVCRARPCATTPSPRGRHGRETERPEDPRPASPEKKNAHPNRRRMIAGSTHKRCTACSEWLPFSAFPKNKSMFRWLSSHCRTCHNAATQDWRERNRDAINRVRREAYGSENPHRYPKTASVSAAQRTESGSVAEA